MDGLIVDPTCKIDQNKGSQFWSFQTGLFGQNVISKISNGRKALKRQIFEIIKFAKCCDEIVSTKTFAIAR